MRPLLFLAALPLLASAQTPVPPSGAPTSFPADAAAPTAEALRNNVAGKVLHATLFDGSTWRIDYRDNGYAYLDTGSGFRDTGKWHLEEDKLCAEWKKAPSGCNEVRTRGDTVFIKRANGEVVALKPR